MLLDFVLNYKEGLVEDVKAEGSLGYNDHEVVEFRILCGRSKAIRRTAALDFRRANFDLFKDLLAHIPWARTLEDARELVDKNTTSSKLKISTSLRARIQEKVARGLHG